jgi:glycine/D-amino acid oxidase-like deaminating enzyme
MMPTEITPFGPLPPALPLHAHVVVWGGGLAGTLLADELLRRGLRVTLVDDAAQNRASRVAAGLYNLVTGKTPKRSWQADRLLTVLNAWIAARPHARAHLHPMPIYRPFANATLANDWQARSCEPWYADHIRCQATPWQPLHLAAAPTRGQLHNPLGGFTLLGAGWAAVGPLLDALQHGIVAQPLGQLLRENLPYSALDAPGRVLHTRNGPLTYDALVFAEGPQAATTPGGGNPHWHQVPIRPLKGELLVVAAPDLRLDRVVVGPPYVVPLGADRYCVGSTYEHRFEHPAPTAAGAAQLRQQFERLFPGVTYSVTDHQAGLRATTPDRRPLLGPLPTPGLWVFNGLGTKGVLLSPWCANVLADALTLGKDLPPEVDLRRYPRA